MRLYEATAVAEVEVLGDLTVGYCTSAGMTISSGGVHDTRRNSLLSVGIFEESTGPGFLFLRVQPAEYDSRKKKVQTLFYKFSQSDRLVDLFLGLEMFVVYFPSSCESRAISSEVTKDALSNNLRIRPW